MSPFKNCSCACEPRAPMPVPANFKIRLTKKVKKNLVAIVEYPDCTNFEGVKILLYKDMTKREFNKYILLDPHFSDKEGSLSPVARFAPTEDGLKLALESAELL